MSMRRLHPDPAATTPEEATSGLRLAELAPADRPYLVLNMVATVDGAATLAGRTRDLSDPTDREVFHGLRTQADCVMVGAGTARVERYGRLVRDPGRRERRRGEGLAPEPVACLVSGTLGIPEDLPLLQEPDARVLVITGSRGEVAGARARVGYLRADAPQVSRPPLAPFLRRMRTEHGIRTILCEGGPRLNSALLDEGLVDELFFTAAPKLAAGTPEVTLVTGPPPPAPLELELLTCHEAAGALYTRYRIRR